MMGFYINSEHLFGLPECSAKLLLQTTENSDPYRLFSVDLIQHEEWNPQGLYCGIHYLTGHYAIHDKSIVWVVPEETWVDIVQRDYLV